jgi:hypothetical protein
MHVKPAGVVHLGLRGRPEEAADFSESYKTFS